MRVFGGASLLVCILISVSVNIFGIGDNNLYIASIHIEPNVNLNFNPNNNQSPHRIHIDNDRLCDTRGKATNFLVDTRNNWTGSHNGFTINFQSLQIRVYSRNEEKFYWFLTLRIRDGLWYDLGGVPYDVCRSDGVLYVHYTHTPND